MENLESPTSTPAQGMAMGKFTAAPETDLRAGLDSLRHLVVSVMVLLVVTSGTLAIFLSTQFWFARTDLVYCQKEIGDMETDLKDMQFFLSGLTEYARTHPDFLPVLAKYGILPVANPTPAAAKGAPATAPAAAQPPKK